MSLKQAIVTAREDDAVWRIIEKTRIIAMNSEIQDEAATQRVSISLMKLRDRQHQGWQTQSILRIVL